MAEDFVVKDSGKREEYASGMVRDVQDDKTLYSLVFRGPLFKRWAEHLTKGALKYGKDNWTLANSVEEQDRFKESAVRHFIQWVEGDRDEDHAAAVLFNINAYEYVRDYLHNQPNNPNPEYGTPVDLQGEPFEPFTSGGMMRFLESHMPVQYGGKTFSARQRGKQDQPFEHKEL